MFNNKLWVILLASSVLFGCGSENDPATKDGGNTSTPPSESTANVAPTVSAGADQTVDVLNPVTLTATATDSDGTVASYLWVQTGGTPPGAPTVTLNNETTNSASFDAPDVAVETTLTFSVTVTDNDGETSSDSINVTVLPVVEDNNTAPAVSAGVGQTVDELSTVTLAATATDADGDTLQANWTQTAGAPSVVISGSDQLTATFDAPDVDAAQTLSFTVSVTDGSVTVVDTVDIVVNPIVAENTAPVIEPILDQSVDELTSGVTLSANATDADGDTLTYYWSQTGGTPQVTLTNADQATSTFTAPDVAADTELTFTVTVTDSNGVAATGTAIVNVILINQIPTLTVSSDATGDTADEQSLVSLTAAATDADGHALTYSWTQTSGAGVTLSATDLSTLEFTAPDVAKGETASLTFEATVDDGFGGVVSEAIVISVKGVNQAPVITQHEVVLPDAPNDPVVGEYVYIDVTATDIDGDDIIYNVLQLPGTEVNSLNVFENRVSFQVPGLDADEDLSFQITATDGELNDVLNVTVSVAYTPFEVSIDDAPAVVWSEGEFALFSSVSGAAGSPTYAWSVVTGAGVVLAATDQRDVYGTAPLVTSDTEIKIQLDVTTAAGQSGFVQQTITVKDGVVDGSAKDTIDTAETVNFGTEIEGQLSCETGNEDLQDLYEITASDSLVTFDFSTSASEGVVNISLLVRDSALEEGVVDVTKLYGSGGVYYFSNYIQTSGITSLHSDVYYIAVERSCERSQLAAYYSLTIGTDTPPVDDSDEPDSRFQDAKTLSQDTVLLGDAWNWDYKKVTVPSGHDGVKVTLGSESILSAEENITVYVLPATNLDTLLGSVEISWDSLSQSNKVQVIAPAGTDLYLIVVPQYVATGPSYALSWTPINVVDDSFEDNDTFGTAAVITAGDIIEASAYDPDYYSFSVDTNNTSVSVDLTGNCDLEVYDSNEVDFWSFSPGESGSITLDAGTYFLLANGCSGDYSFKLSII